MVQRLFDLEARLPAWLRPTWRGALFIFGMSFGWIGKLFVLLILATLMLLAGPGPGAALFLRLLLVVVTAGALGGTLRALLQPLERWGALGSWLCWTCSIFGYLATLGLLTPTGPFSRQYSTFYAIVAVISALAAGGLVLLDDRRFGRPSPRRFRLLQGRERLWAEAARARVRMQSRSLP